MNHIFMNPRVEHVKPNLNYTITLTFNNGEVKVFDVKPYLDKGIFRELKEISYLDKGIFRELKEISLFNSVKPFLGSVQWQNGQDFCPD